jgi:hypothetical protein
MRSFDPKLEVRLVDDEIVVTLPGTSYSVTYYKMIGSPGLMAKRIADTDDPRSPQMSVSEFLAKAWKVGNDKARELGWIDERERSVDPKLDVQVFGNAIIVSLLGTSYSVTYFKRKNSRGLSAKDIESKDDPRIPMKGAEFITKAWKLANDKARELGWIV